MRQFFGSSQRGDLAEAIRGLRTPQFIMLLSNNAQFESHVSALPVPRRAQHRLHRHEL